MNASTIDPAARKRLFSGICMALIPTGMSFALIAAIIPQIRTEFILTNTQAGAIAGAAIWGMAISLLVLGPMLEGYGMKNATWAAFLGHLIGVTVMLSAAAFTDNPTVGFWILMLGAAIFAAGNGMIEVSGNPLTAALYPEKKAHMLNIFHAFFPLAIMAGSFIALFLGTFSTETFVGHWTFYIALIYIPIIFYGILVLPQKFPKTENAEAGLSVKEMFRYTLTHPLMYLLLIMMAIAIGLELGIKRWIPPIFTALNLPGLWMMSLISFIMMTLRFFSGPILARISPPALLATAAFSTCVGIFLFGITDSTPMAFLAAAFFGAGVAFYFPTIVGLVSERLPKTGSLGIVLTCGIGLLSAGTLGNMGVGALGDRQLGYHLEDSHKEFSVALLEVIHEQYEGIIEPAAAAADPIAEYGLTSSDASRVNDRALRALERVAADDSIEGRETPLAFRAVGGAAQGLEGRLFKASGYDFEAMKAELGEEAFAERKKELQEELKAAVQAVLESNDAAAVVAFAGQSMYHSAHLAKSIMGPSEGIAGQAALKQLAWVPLIMVVFFGIMFLKDKASGGYKVVRLDSVTGKVSVKPERGDEMMEEVADKISRPLGVPKDSDSSDQS